MSPERLIRWGRAFMLAWDLIFVAACIQIATSHEPFPGANPGATVAVVALGLLWAWFWIRVRRAEWIEGALLAGLGMLAIGLPLLVVTPPGTSIAIFGGVILCAALPARWALLAALLTSVLAFLPGALKGYPSIGFGIAFNNLLVALAAIGGRVFVSSYVELARAREEIARLAVAEERLRFSRDLHDLLGHSLAVIVLKSEVVARRLAGDREARAEVGEIAQVARRSLEQVREAVSGYRAPSLDHELANARAALTGARIEAGFENTAGALPAPAQSLFGWAVREGVTNVIKHSAARRCRIQLAQDAAAAILEIENDGVAEGGFVPGNGIQGLEERAQLLNAAVSVESAQGRFRLRVRVPLEERPALLPA